MLLFCPINYVSKSAFKWIIHLVHNHNAPSPGLVVVLCTDWSGGYKMPPLSLECNSGMLQVLFTFLEQLPAFLFYSSLMEKWTRLFIVHFNRCYSCWHLLSILELVVSRTCNRTCPLQVKWHWIMPTRRGEWGFCRLRVLWLFANPLLSNI